MAISVLILVYSYSVYRTWNNPLYPFVFLLFSNSLEFWAKSSSQILFQNAYIMDLFGLALVAFAVVRHSRPEISRGLKFTRVEAAFIFIFAYAWFSYGWSLDNPHFSTGARSFSKIFIIQVMYLLLLPLLMRSALRQRIYDIAMDIRLTAAVVIPLAAFTINWEHRRVIVDFITQIDVATGSAANSLLNPLELAYYASIVVLANILFFKRRFFDIAVLGLLTPVAGYLLLNTQSRGQIFALLISLLLFVPFVYQSLRSRHYTMLMPIVVSVMILGALNVGTIMSLFAGAFGFEADFSQRYAIETMIAAWGERGQAIENAISHWGSSIFGMLFGIGTTSTISDTVSGIYIHNIPLEILIEQGLFIFLLFVLANGYVILSMYHAFNFNILSAVDRNLLVFLSSLYVLNLVLSFKQNTLVSSYAFFSTAMLFSVFYTHLKREYGKGAFPLQKKMPQLTESI